MDRVWAFTIVRNEEKMLPWWLRHYGAFCDRMIVYDDMSDDNTRKLATAAGATVLDYPRGTGLDDLEMAEFASLAYRKARNLADWIIFVDADEFVVTDHAKLARLGRSGATMARVEGYQMFGGSWIPPELYPAQLWQYVDCGVADSSYSKQVVFRPQVDARFSVGRHSTHVDGLARVSPDAEPLKLLHYRWFGREYFEERNRRNWARVSARGKAAGWGIHTSPGFAGLNDVDQMEAMALRSRPIWTGS